ncbi:MAG: type II secretion system protein [Magnetococcales bacterium]|nr:type II secretion system protein [Magnetococcales bacterium]
MTASSFDSGTADRTVHNSHGESGVSLIELTVILAIIGLVSSAGINVMVGIKDTANKARNAQLIADAQSALITFSSTNYRLPCPANPDLIPGNAGYGLEDCTRDAGMIPHVTLVLDQAALDTSMQPIRYVVYRVADTTLDGDGNQSLDGDLATAVNRVDNLGEDGLINIWDFCLALENGNTAFGTGEASISTLPLSGSGNGCREAGSFANQAFVLASSGNRDSSRPADGNLFDGINAAGNTCFSSPDQPWDTSYDDVIAASSFTTLLGMLCQ